ncbi:hypothetical protein HPB48_000338 [Haemaphysalis longicornis]|uniref:Uncharacterized protein n=1 Tax=Haemaphysalis longicornis TaxID=44386 RepID=A0A9J6GIV1_HAELO|nr:hypothetical protein HPB48_000338 [Haemaphysalis longicornis]
MCTDRENAWLPPYVTNVLSARVKFHTFVVMLKCCSGDSKLFHSLFRFLQLRAQGFVVVF